MLTKKAIGGRCPGSSVSHLGPSFLIHEAPWSMPDMLMDGSGVDSETVYPKKKEEGKQ